MASARLKKSLSVLGSVLEAVFYLLLIVCLSISIVVTLRSFMGNTNRATQFSLKTVQNHTHPGILFFGNDFSLFLCSNFKMRAGSTDFMTMLLKGRNCVTKSVSIAFNETIISEWIGDDFDHETSDFMTSINYLVEDADYERRENSVKSVNVSFNVIMTRGPSLWIHQDAIFMTVTSPKQETLHPYYVVNDFYKSKRSMEEVDATAMGGDPLKAVFLLEEMLRNEGAVFRFTPTESVALNSMFRENFLDDGKLESSRITLEQTISTTMYDNSGFCDHDENQNENADPPNEENVDSETSKGEETRSEYAFDYEEGWGNHKESFSESKTKLCSGIPHDQTYSDSSFRWFDGLVLESNSFDTFDPWSVFSTLTSVILALDRIYTTGKRYKSAYLANKRKQAAAPVEEEDSPKKSQTPAIEVPFFTNKTINRVN